MNDEEVKRIERLATAINTGIQASEPTILEGISALAIVTSIYIESSVEILKQKDSDSSEEEIRKNLKDMFNQLCEVYETEKPDKETASEAEGVGQLSTES